MAWHLLQSIWCVIVLAEAWSLELIVGKVMCMWTAQTSAMPPPTATLPGFTRSPPEACLHRCTPQARVDRQRACRRTMVCL